MHDRLRMAGVLEIRFATICGPDEFFFGPRSSSPFFDRNFLAGTRASELKKLFLTINNASKIS